VLVDSIALVRALEAGADANAVDASTGDCIIHRVCRQWGRWEGDHSQLPPASVLRRVLERYDVNIEARRRHNDQEAAMHMAARLRDPLGHLTALLAHGADVDAFDINGRTPLHYAATPAAVRLLLARGAAAVPVDSDGATPAHAFAREARSKALTEWLRVPVATTAEVLNVRDAVGMTALHVATSTRRH